MRKIILEDKKKVLYFPSDMSNEDVRDAIDKNYYPEMYEKRQREGLKVSAMEKVMKEVEATPEKWESFTSGIRSVASQFASMMAGGAIGAGVSVWEQGLEGIKKAIMPPKILTTSFMEKPKLTKAAKQKRLEEEWLTEERLKKAEELMQGFSEGVQKQWGAKGEVGEQVEETAFKAIEWVDEEIMNRIGYFVTDVSDSPGLGAVAKTMAWWYLPYKAGKITKGAAAKIKSRLYKDVSKMQPEQVTPEVLEQKLLEYSNETKQLDWRPGETFTMTEPVAEGSYVTPEQLELFKPHEYIAPEQLKLPFEEKGIGRESLEAFLEATEPTYEHPQAGKIFEGKSEGFAYRKALEALESKPDFAPYYYLESLPTQKGKFRFQIKERPEAVQLELPLRQEGYQREFPYSDVEIRKIKSVSKGFSEVVVGKSLDISSPPEQLGMFPEGGWGVIGKEFVRLISKEHERPEAKEWVIKQVENIWRRVHEEYPEGFGEVKNVWYYKSKQDLPSTIKDALKKHDPKFVPGSKGGFYWNSIDPTTIYLNWEPLAQVLPTRRARYKSMAEVVIHELAHGEERNFIGENLKKAHPEWSKEKLWEVTSEISERLANATADFVSQQLYGKRLEGFKGEQLDFLYGGIPFRDIPKIFSEQLGKFFSLPDYLKYKLGYGPILPLDVKDYRLRFDDWFKNKKSVLSKTEPGRNIYDAGITYRGDSKAQLHDFLYKSDLVWDKTTPQEQKLIMEILNGDRVPKEGKPLSPQAERILDKAVIARELTIEVRDYMIKNGIPMGYITDYFMHMYSGDYIIKFNDSFAGKFKSEFEGWKRFMEELRDNPDTKVEFWKEVFTYPDEASILSRKNYFRLEGAIKRTLGEKYKLLDDAEIKKIIRDSGMKMTTKEIRAALHKAAKPSPRPRFFGNTLQRLKNDTHYIKDPKLAFEMYLYSAVRKVNQDIFLRTVETELGKLPPEAYPLKNWINESFVNSILGRPTALEEAIAAQIGKSPVEVRRFVGKLNNAQVLFDLGASISTTMVNSFQFWSNTVPIIGVKYGVFGWKTGLAVGAKTERGRILAKELWDERVLTQVSAFTGRPLADVVKIKTFGDLLDLTLRPFEWAELYANRASTYFGGKKWAEDLIRRNIKNQEKLVNTMFNVVDLVETGQRNTSSLFKLVEQIRERGGITEKEITWFSKEAAKQLIDKTQFRFGSENTPLILDSPFFRLASPYKSFLQNQVKYSYERLSPTGIWKHPKEALKFFAITYALAGVYGNPMTFLYYKMADYALKNIYDYDIDDELLKKHDIKAGLLGKLGVDVASSVALNMPRRWRDWFGRWANVVMTAAEIGYRKVIGKPTTEQVERLKWMFYPSQLQKARKAVDIIRTGKYKSPITGDTIIIPEDKVETAIKVFLGLNPEDLREMYETDRGIQMRKTIMNEVISDYRDRIATAIVENDREKLSTTSKEITERMKTYHNVIKSKSASESLRFEALTDFNRLLDIKKDIDSYVENKTFPYWFRRMEDVPKAMRPEYLYKHKERFAPEKSK